MDTTKYIEDEVKVLRIDVGLLQEKLAGLGATLEFDAERSITHFDTPDRKLSSAGKSLKLTEEGTAKLSIGKNLPGDKRTEIKVKVSRKEETIALLTELDLIAVAETRARRISYVWKGADIDIDFFQNIDPFAEIDPGTSDLSTEQIIEQLGLTENEQVVMGTPNIFEKKYGRNYFQDFAV